MGKSEDAPASTKLPPKKGGRKPILDPELVAASLVSLSGNISAVAKKMGVDRSAIRQLIDKRPSLQQILTDCREGMKDSVESRFYSDCLKDEPQYQTSRIFFLKTQCRDRGYIERHEQVDNSLGELVRSLIGDGLATRRKAVGEPAVESGGTGESRPAPAVEDAESH